MTPLEQIAEARTEAKNLVELADHLDKLRKNRSFKALFDEYILKDLPLQAAGMFNRPGNSEIAQDSLEKLLTMVSMLNHTLSTVYTKADQAQQTLKEIDDAEAEYLAEVE
tara:strand:+ start:1845 stop:2174 length:330 start_codon:yes stop_codon:yes gene_type:complete